MILNTSTKILYNVGDRVQFWEWSKSRADYDYYYTSYKCWRDGIISRVSKVEYVPETNTQVAYYDITTENGKYLENDVVEDKIRISESSEILHFLRNKKRDLSKKKFGKKQTPSYWADQFLTEMREEGII